MKVLSRIKDARTNILTLLMILFLFLLQRKLKLPSCPLVLIFFGDDNRKIESKNNIINIVIDEGRLRW